MASDFRSGTKVLQTGDYEVSVTGLSLAFTPTNVVVSVRQPSGDADLVQAFVTGTPTTDGFTAVLSTPIPSAGYLLDYTIFSEGGISPVAGDTLAVSYGELRGVVAAFLGYDVSALTTAQSNTIDAYIQSGIRNFYYPPKMEGVDENFEWSFIRQNATVSCTAGVESYTLPNGFGRIAGQIAVVGDDGKTIPVVPYGAIVSMRSRPRQDRPVFAAVTSEQSFGSRGQLKRLHLYPTPDKAYTLAFVGDADTGRIDAVNRPFPLGGAMFSELVTESCLAIAEQRANDEEGIHTKNFNALLVSAIARDRKSTAQSFGDIGDPEYNGISEFRPLATRGLLY